MASNIIYDSYENKASYYYNDFLISTLKFNNDEFEQFDNINLSEEYMCSEMTKARDEYDEALHALKYENQN